MLGGDEGSMDVKAFSKIRLDFIRFYYREGRKPYDAIKQAIDNAEPPYNEQPWSEIENGEPPFLSEWLEADMALNVLGYSCLSMLANSLKITFTNIEKEFGFISSKNVKTRRLFNKGFVPAYKSILSEVLDTDWSDCPSNFAIIEQVVLARNNTQHTDDFSGFDAYHNEKTIEKYPHPFFVGDYRLSSKDADVITWRGSRIEVTEDDLFHAIEEVEKLVDYIMNREEKAYQWRQARKST